MISIIICSRTKTINDILTDNIQKTIGCEYELVIIDNSENQYSIFEAYNLGISNSNGDYLCLIHDDILFHTLGWGNIIQRSKTKMPSLWWSCPKEHKTASLIQHLSDKETERWNSGFGKESAIEVVTIDGVFMAMRKDDRICFNSQMKGFHNYDLNISFEYKKFGYKVIVTNEVLIEHFSLGTIKDEWVESSYQLYNFYKNSLPLNFESNRINKSQEISNAVWFINECLTFKKYKIAFAIWKRLFHLNPFLRYHLIFWKRIIINS
jgi:glycosyltransferase involved in cell wall biosynthesis